MKKYSHITIKKSAFTLIEVLISMTILSVIMVSMLMIYATASEIALKADLNREMQQNIKSVVETLATDIRKNWITAVSPSWTTYLPSSSTWSALKVWIDKYMLVDADDLLNPWYLRKDLTYCSDIKNVCSLAKIDGTTGKWIWPLTNSKISFTNLEFGVTQWAIPKVTLNMTVRAAIKNWVRPDLIKNSVIHFQTTISERTLQVK